MRWIAKIALIGVVLLSGVQAQATEQIRWSGSLTDALAQAKKSNQLVMVDFYSDTCVWCKRLDQDVYPTKQVVDTAKNIIMVKLNVEDARQGTAAATKYKVFKLPTILYMKSDGSVVHTSGYMPPNEFATDMREAINVHKNFPVWEAKYKKSPQDSANTRILAKTMLKAGRLIEAEQIADTLAKYAPNDSILAEFYNALGRNYAMDGDVDKGKTLFKKALAKAKAPIDRAEANFFMGICAMTKRDKAGATTYLKNAVAVPGVPPALKQKAQEILDMLAKS